MDNKKDFRTRNWSTIVYLDSAPSNWLEILDNLLIPCLISPYHDKDINPDGTSKKPHYHVLLLFESVKSQNQVEDLISQFNGVGCFRINSLRAYARYLCHLDNPEKHQYPTSEVKALYGLDYEEIIMSESDNYKIIDDIIDFIDSTDCISFYLLCKYARQTNQSWKRVLTSKNTVFFKEYLKSRVWSNEKEIKHITNLRGEQII